MADGTLSSIHYAERFRWFASEYLEIRRSKGSLLDHAYLTDDLVQLIHDAFKSRLLPCELQNRAESSGVGSAGMLGVRLIGYQSFVDVTQPDEKFVDDPTRVLELRPGWMGELWPQFFPSLMYVSSRPDEPYGEMIVKAKKDRFFVYVGAFAKLCELIAENIEREMAADNRADEDGLGFQLNGTLTENDRSILIAMLDLKADKIQPRVSKEILGAVIFENEVGDSKRAFDNLSSLKLIESKRGPSGGYYLTEQGMAIAKDLKSRSG
ncbi:MAG: hypothetical protein ACK6AO_17565 [Planctomycetota bacterium]|jgi:hypothetical protein